MREVESKSEHSLRPISMGATQRIIEAVGVRFPRGLKTREQQDQHLYAICSALNFIAQYVAISETWFDVEAEQDALLRELNALDDESGSRIAVCSSELKCSGAIEEGEIAAEREDLIRKLEALGLRKKSRSPFRPKEFSTHFYPWFLALYDLSFAEKPTASYHAASEKNSGTTGFIHAALIEINEVVPELSAPLGPFVKAALRETASRRQVINIPNGDSLRKAIERALKETKGPSSNEIIAVKSRPGRPRRVWQKCRKFLKSNYFRRGKFTN